MCIYERHVAASDQGWQSRRAACGTNSSYLADCTKLLVLVLFTQGILLLHACAYCFRRHVLAPKAQVMDEGSTSAL